MKQLEVDWKISHMSYGNKFDENNDYIMLINR